MNSVEFIEDYIGLTFGELTLYAMSDPIKVEDERVTDRSDPAYSAALIKLIGETVQKIEDTKERLVIGFAKSHIIIPLDSDSTPGPEMATLSGRGQFFQAWLRTDS